MCINLCLCMFVCVLVWGRKGAVGRKVRKNGIWRSQQTYFCHVFLLFSHSHSYVFSVIPTIYFLSCILSSDDTVDRRCKTHINYHTCICIRTAYFSERAAPPSFSLSRNVETFLLKNLFSTFPEIIVCCHTNIF